MSKFNINNTTVPTNLCCFCWNIFVFSLNNITKMVIIRCLLVYTLLMSIGQGWLTKSVNVTKFLFKQQYLVNIIFVVSLNNDQCDSARPPVWSNFYTPSNFCNIGILNLKKNNIILNKIWCKIASKREYLFEIIK